MAILLYLDTVFVSIVVPVIKLIEADRNLVLTFNIKTLQFLKVNYYIQGKFNKDRSYFLLA